MTARAAAGPAAPGARGDERSPAAGEPGGAAGRAAEDAHRARAEALAAAVARLAAGGLVAYPTETVWGLGAAAARPRAVDRLREWKGRAEAHALSLLVPGTAALGALGAELPPAARALAERFWPGPLTLVLRCRAPLAAGVAAADGSVGFRCSPHPAAAALARAALDAGLGPITATSLNRSGEPPARTRGEAAALCGVGGTRVPLGPDSPDADAPALLGGDWPDAGGAAPSSVVDVTGPSLRLLREGALSEAEILEAVRTAAPGGCGRFA